MLEENFNSQTTWVNDSDEIVTIKLYFGGSRKKKWETVKILPGTEVKLPSEFDDAIRKEKDGLVVGGKCPWLKKKGETEVNLHPSLDYKAVQEELEIKDLAVKLQNSKALEQAIALHNKSKVAKTAK